MNFFLLDCKNLIKGMLNIDPNKRFDLTDIFNHRWLKIDEDSNSSINNSILDSGSMPNSQMGEFRNLISKIENMLVKTFIIKQNYCEKVMF